MKSSLTLVSLTLLLPWISLSYPMPPQRKAGGGFQMDQPAAYQHYESAMNVQPQPPLPLAVPASRAIVPRQPPYRARNDDYFDDPTGNSSMFVLSMLAIVIGVPCFLCYSRKNNVIPCCGDNVPAAVDQNAVITQKSRRPKRPKIRRHRRSDERADQKSFRRREKEGEDSLSDENDSISLDDEEFSNSDSPDGRKSRKKDRRYRGHRRSNSADRTMKRTSKKIKERERKRMLNSLSDDQADLCSSTTSAPPSSTKIMTSTSNASANPQQQQQQHPQTAGKEEYTYVVYCPDTNHVTVSRSLKDLVPPNTTVVYKVDETSNMHEVGSLLKNIKSRIKCGGRPAKGANTEQSPGKEATGESPTSLYLPGSPNSGKTFRSIRSNYFIVNSDALLKKTLEQQEEREKENEKGEEVQDTAKTTAEMKQEDHQQPKQQGMSMKSPIKTNSTMFVYSTKMPFGKWSGLMGQPVQQQPVSSQPQPQGILKPLESLPIGAAAGEVLKQSQPNVHCSAHLNGNPLSSPKQQLSFESNSDDFEGEEDEEEEDDSSNEEEEERKRRKKMRARERRQTLKHRKHRRQSIPNRKMHRLKQRRGKRSHRSIRV